MEAKKKEKKCEEGAPEYMLTYGDIMSLLLTFFIMLLSAARIEGQEVKLILANFPGLGNYLGGQSFNKGKLPFSGQLREALPSIDQGRSFAPEVAESIQLLQDELSKKTISVRKIEKGLVVSFAADYYFEKYSAVFNLERGIETINKVSKILKTFIAKFPELKYTLEGFTDETGFPIGSPYVDEWGLSTARAVTILRLFEQYLVPTKNARVIGFGNNFQSFQDDGAGSPFNRRVDLVIITDGNL